MSHGRRGHGVRSRRGVFAAARFGARALPRNGTAIGRGQVVTVRPSFPFGVNTGSPVMRSTVMPYL